MTKKLNTITFFTILLLILNLILGCENKIRNINEIQSKDSSNVMAMEPQKYESNKNNAKPKSIEDNEAAKKQQQLQQQLQQHQHQLQQHQQQLQQRQHKPQPKPQQQPHSRPKPQPKPQQPQPLQPQQPQQPQTQQPQQDNIAPNDKSENQTIPNKQGYIRNSSGIVTSVPWENDADFKNAQDKYSTNILLAAYCTVLPDPMPGEEENVHVGAKLLNGTVVEPGKVFSQNHTIGPYTKERGYKKGPTYVGSRITTTIGGGVCKIATTLYNVAVMSNLQIVERHAHGMPVSYAPHGQDATVSYGTYDLRFKNNTDHPILIWTEAIDSNLYIGFYGKSKPPKVQWHHEVLDIKKTKTIYKENPKLNPGTKKLIIIGADGAKVKSWVTIEQPDGTVITKQLGKSIYSPLPYIYEKGRSVN